MPTYTVRVAASGFFEDTEIDAPTPDEACDRALELGRDGEIIPCEPYEYSCRHDTYIASVEDADGNSFDVPRHCWDYHDKVIADLQEEITRLKHKCGEL